MVLPNGYRSDKEGLYLASRAPRKRIFIPVKGNGKAGRQLRIIIVEERARIILPVDVKARKRQDYTNTVYAYIGYSDMLTLSNGNVYGKELGSLVTPETERLAEKNKERGRIRAATDESLKKKLEENNLGSKKYDAQKRWAWEKHKILSMQS